MGNKNEGLTIQIPRVRYKYVSVATWEMWTECHLIGVGILIQQIIGRGDWARVLETIIKTGSD